jgi:hypothetical protein
MYRRLTALAVCAALAACHDHEAMPTVATDTTAPQAAIVFPARDAATTAATFHVAGTAQDNVAVAAVRVNGVLATSTDAFAHWSADVPLDEGNQTLTVEVVDGAGNRVASADNVQVLRRVGIEQSAGGEIDSNTQSLYYVDTQALAINRISLTTGVVSRVADLARFGGGALPLDLALDLGHNRILLGVRRAAQDGSSTIGVWSFNTQTRSWSAMSDAATGTGPLLANPVRLELSADGLTLYVAEFSSGIYAVNTGTGNRTLISSNTVPNTSAALFSEVMDLSLDAANNRLLVLDRGSDAVFAVSLASGARTAISRTGVQAGPALDFPLSMALDSANNRALVYEAAEEGVLAVDLGTGIRSLVDTNAQIAQGSDQDLGSSDVRALFWRNNRLVLLDNGMDHVLSIDPVTHSRERLANNSFPGLKQRSIYGNDSVMLNGAPHIADGEKNQLVSTDGNGAQRVVAGASVTGSGVFATNDLVIGTAPGTLYAVDYGFSNTVGFPQIRAVNTATGAISSVLGGPLNTITSEYPAALTVTGANGYLVTTDGVYRVDMAAGTRTLLSAPGAWSLGSVRQLVVDSARNRLLLAAANRTFLIAVDLNTGVQTEFSPSTAAGPALVTPWGVVISPAGEIWVSDATVGVMRVDATSGARTLVSGPGAPDNETQPAGGSGGFKSLQFDGEALYGIDVQGEIFQIDTRTGHRAAILSGWNFPRNRAPQGGISQ